MTDDEKLDEDARLILQRRRIMTMRVDGASWDEIATTQNTTVADVREQYKLAIGDACDDVDGLAFHDLELRMRRFDKLLQKAMEATNSEDLKTSIDAIKACTDLEAKRSSIILSRARHEEIRAGLKSTSTTKEAFVLKFVGSAESDDEE